MASIRSYASPLRYPGGKTALAGFLAETIELNGLRGCHYTEPFAGGAGAALQLLFDGLVSSVHINDKDPCIHSFWWSVIEETEAFLARLQATSASLEEWDRQRAVLRNPTVHSMFDLGFATFYVNRCSHSGVLNGGPIGGVEQTGKYKIGARFYKDELFRRIRQIGLNRHRIQISNQDGIECLRSEYATAGGGNSATLVYMDPPYFKKGHRLYEFYFEDEDHERLADFLKSEVRPEAFHWILSCNDAVLIRRLYPGKVRSLRFRYSLRSARVGRELMLSSNGCSLPPRFRRFKPINNPRLQLCHGLP